MTAGVDGKASYEVLLEGRREVLGLERSGNRVRVRLAGRYFEVDVAQLSESSFSLILEGRSYDVTVNPHPDGFQVFVDGVGFQVGLHDPRRRSSFSSGRTEAAGPMAVSTPMPGKVVKVLISEGDSVQEGQGLLVVEAMKMQNELSSRKQAGSNASTCRRARRSTRGKRWWSSSEKSLGLIQPCLARHDFFHSVHVGPEHWRYGHTAVRLLVILEDGDPGPTYGQTGPVERVDEFRFVPPGLFGNGCWPGRDWKSSKLLQEEISR